jgi:ABC-type nitrate/sulfonate/bicarbonate transport system ATPase subunit
MSTRTGAPTKEPLSNGKETALAGAGGAGDTTGGSDATAVRIDALEHAYGELRTLAGLSLRAAPNEVLGIVGPSGCGKSTLLELIAGLREPDAGTIALDDARTPAERLARCAYMPQRDLLLPWMTAIDNASLALLNRGVRRADARRQAAQLFERFGLGSFELSRPAELSGGMRQRVAFLRTLLSGKPVLLLDEPFASLDAITRGEMQEWLVSALAADPRTVVLVTHDVEEALYLSHRVAVVSRRPGRVVTEIEIPTGRRADRAAEVTSPRFAALRERAMRALLGEKA